MSKVLIVDISCPICKQTGAARWIEDSAENGQGTTPSVKRKLDGLSAGFCSIDRWDGQAPELVCMRCNDTHVASAESEAARAPHSLQN